MSDEQESFIDYGDLLYVLVWNGNAKESAAPVRPAPFPQFGPERFISAVDSANENNQMYASPNRKLVPMKLAEFLKQQNRTQRTRNEPKEPQTCLRSPHSGNAGSGLGHTG